MQGLSLPQIEPSPARLRREDGERSERSRGRTDTSLLPKGFPLGFPPKSLFLPLWAKGQFLSLGTLRGTPFAASGETCGNLREGKLEIGEIPGEDRQTNHGTGERGGEGVITQCRGADDFCLRKNGSHRGPRSHLEGDDSKVRKGWRSDRSGKAEEVGRLRVLRRPHGHAFADENAAYGANYSVSVRPETPQPRVTAL